MRPKDWDSLAHDYHDIVISPFQAGVKNPLFRKLAGIKAHKSKVIADIGCGRGEIVDKLAKMFKHVHAMDFSKEMISISRKNTLSKNVDFYVQDMRRLSPFKKKFDVVITVNSVIMPKINDVKRSLEGIHDSLKDGGLFYGIFPSMGSII